ncbi:quinone oxidoreductase family protein [Neobacillus sp. D3-1R]|uniref:quinone oxidoreductase family protein n=1 Tax=Neobacillus sp. D3-1R TaxID=3445778 RepID=UPI003FA12E76
MKAILVTEFGGPQVMKYSDIPLPTIKPNQVLIRVIKTSVNFADIKSRYGKKGGGNIPYIPGIDATGIIESVGEAVQSLQIGQRVIAFPQGGSYSEYVVADEALTFVIPDSLDFGMAAACPIVSFLSYQLLMDIARLEKGETVLIHSAAGGVGTTAIQLAKLLGASKIIGTVGNSSKKNVALDAGADEVICYTEGNFSDKVNEITDGNGVNIVLDSLAGKITEESLNCLAPYGRLVHFGNSSGSVGNIQTKDLHSSCRSVMGFSFGTTRKLRPYTLKNVAEQVLPLIANGQLSIKIGANFPLSEAAHAHEWMESRKSTGKILLDVQD